MQLQVLLRITAAQQQLQLNSSYTSYSSTAATATPATAAPATATPATATPATATSYRSCFFTGVYGYKQHVQLTVSFSRQEFLHVVTLAYAVSSVCVCVRVRVRVCILSVRLFRSDELRR